LAKVERILSEQTVVIMDAVRTLASCTYNSPSVSSVAALIPEEHTSGAAVLKEFKPH
jgi:hypothetical protein